MRVLVVKTSSMGDVIHTLPALTDASKVFPDIKFDWVVEENFAEIPRWHPRVDRIIPVALRRWRKDLFAAKTREEWKRCRELLRSTSYDFIIDAQGLLKSAWLVWMAKGKRCGLNWNSAREPLASLFYQRKCEAGEVKAVHAVTRMRRLFSEALQFELKDPVPNYGIDRQQFVTESSSQPYVVFLHGTTWTTKHWPEDYWIDLAKKVTQAGYVVKLPWGSPTEEARAKRIASACGGEVLPRMKLAEVAGVLAGAKAIVAVDTGLGHLAAALDVPAVSLYGPTNAELTGAVGQSQIHLSVQFKCAPCLNKECTFAESSSVINPPCFETVSPSIVWNTLTTLL